MTRKVRFHFQQAPIRMTRTFFPFVRFEANPAFAQRDPEKPINLGVNISEVKIEIFPNDPNSFLVGLDVALEWPDTETPPYHHASVRAMGVFELHPDAPPAVKLNHRHMSAPSMLYASAREIVRHVTANGPWDEIILPAVTITAEMLPADEEENPADPVESKDIQGE